ncbi:MAG: class I SAM-dependent methyltransferase [Alphaproteobacteria bacterium]|nr:class I SAM-dependent methyltransferase [Alphaproteobacteria bacterium]MBV9862465.1 class I SAM-dependent methyltransferase [Alphaproteobacteria bacterium]
MTEQQIRFEDGAAYERMMGVWSRSVGEIFLDWVAPQPGLRWIDIGCGNAAFTQLLCERCAPAQVDGIDPSPAQLDYARTRPGVRGARFHEGSAIALPFPDCSFDIAVMALVLFFVPEPAKGVAEMARVTVPGGTIAAYLWDIPGGGLPIAPIYAEMRAMGMNPPMPPSADASRTERLQQLWRDAGLVAVETKRIDVTRTFADFDDYWTVSASGAGPSQIIAEMSPQDAARLKAGVSARLPAAAGPLTHAAHANAVKGRVPG